MKYLLHLEFNGKRYCGWQHQDNAVSVSDVVMNAVRSVFGSVEAFNGCSRTDSGVHACDFCVSFSVSRDMEPATLCRALNAHLPSDIRAVKAERKDDAFHARYSVREKEYVYKICPAHDRSVFFDGLVLPYARTLDTERLDREAAVLLGRHDFTSFMATGSKVTDCTRTVTKAYFEREGELTVFHIAADGFLYNMVRIIVGTLLEIDEGKIPDMASVLEAKDRKKAGRTVPAQGLYLYRVTY